MISLNNKKGDHHTNPSAREKKRKKIHLHITEEEISKKLAFTACRQRAASRLWGKEVFLSPEGEKSNSRITRKVAFPRFQGRVGHRIRGKRPASMSASEEKAVASPKVTQLDDRQPLRSRPKKETHGPGKSIVSSWKDWGPQVASAVRQSDVWRKKPWPDVENGKTAERRGEKNHLLPCQQRRPLPEGTKARTIAGRHL